MAGADLRSLYPFLHGGEKLDSGLVDRCLVVETDSIHRVQEVHMVCHRILRDLVRTLLADHRGKLGEKT
jgi:D-sedoheptulose 7-phosphate isomerase